MTKVNIVWFLLLSASVLILFYLGGRITVVENKIVRLKQPAFVQDEKYSLQQTYSGRSLKTGNLEDKIVFSTPKPIAMTYATLWKNQSLIEKDKRKIKKEKNANEIGQTYSKHFNTSVIKIKRPATMLKRPIGQPQSRQSNSQGSGKKKFKNLFSLTDFGRNSQSKPVRYGIQLAMSQLNYEFSSSPDPVKSNLPTFHPPKFQPDKANQMEIVGNIKVGEDVPVESSRQILIATTWRSGSTFLGDLLNHYPGSFYYFEPLHYYSNIKTRAPLQSEPDFLTSLYNCTFDKNNLGFLHHVTNPNNKFLFKNHNFRLWNSCKNILPQEIMCLEPIYLNKLCPRYPIKLIKTVRLRVSKIESLLTNPGLDLKVVVLVRDPRGVYNSRSSGPVSTWCNKETCADPEVGCQNLLDDIRSASDLENRFPGTVRIVRYEDLSLFPEDTTRGMLKFLDLPWHSAIDHYIDTHTTREKSKLKKNKKTGKLEKKSDTYGTTRNSSVTAFAWKEHLSWEKIVNIQEVCSEPMSELGYKKINKYKDIKSTELPIDKTATEIWPYN